MSWVNGVIPFLFICIFIYGLIKQIQQSVILQKTISAADPINRRLLIGNHFYTFASAGFVFLLLMNVLVYFGITPQTQTISNTVSLLTVLFLVLMFIAKFAVIPKSQCGFPLYIKKL
ncbi:hypothetical protein ACRC6Q_07770 [Planococcus sp. SE5232]|uniref:hypothetical protein n=1 Tax=unclassified Planococcus (in: firmicutes) TaxID=2662419 RepID=UPI003D6B9FB0